MTGAGAARLAAVLFAITAVFFAIGVSSENDEHDESIETPTAAHDQEAEAAHNEEAEGDDAHDEAAEGEEAHDEEGEEETVLGLDVESPGTVGLAVVLSGLLAASLWFRPLRPVAGIAVAFGLAFAALDLAEVAHQLDESRTSLAVLAGAIALGHAIAALAAGRAALNPPSSLT